MYVELNIYIYLGWHNFETHTYICKLIKRALEIFQTLHTNILYTCVHLFWTFSFVHMKNIQFHTWRHSVVRTRPPWLSPAEIRSIFFWQIPPACFGSFWDPSPTPQDPPSPFRQQPGKKASKVTHFPFLVHCRKLLRCIYIYIRICIVCARSFRAFVWRVRRKGLAVFPREIFMQIHRCLRLWN